MEFGELREELLRPLVGRHLQPFERGLTCDLHKVSFCRRELLHHPHQVEFVGDDQSEDRSVFRALALHRPVDPRLCPTFGQRLPRFARKVELYVGNA